MVAIGISFGANAGYAINPARDFGPRMFAWVAGWKEIAMPGNYGNVNTYFWIPILGPIVGAGIGAAVYDGLIRSVLRARARRRTEMADYIGAIDQGTTSTRFIVFDRDGQIVTSTSASTSRSPRRPAGSSTTPRRSGRARAR